MRDDVRRTPALPLASASLDWLALWVWLLRHRNQVQLQDMNQEQDMPERAPQ